MEINNEVPQNNSTEISQVRVEQIGKVRTKLGLSMLLNGLVVWLLGIASILILSSITTMFFGEDSSKNLVFGIACLIPLVPLFIFLNGRLNNYITGSNGVSDIYYSKTVKTNLVLTIILSVIVAITFVYKVLDSLLLSGTETAESIVYSLIYLIVFSAMALFFYNYYGKSQS